MQQHSLSTPTYHWSLLFFHSAEENDQSDCNDDAYVSVCKDHRNLSVKDLGQRRE